MIVIGKDVLAAFTGKHTDAKGWINNWLVDFEGSTYEKPQDIKNKYSSASFLSGNTVIFNVKGGSYRLETIVAYKVSTIEVTWAGTHKEYDERNKTR